MRFLGTQATARVSLAPYNTADDIQALVRAIHAAQRVFA
jgi:selenocysteine lyase/cysteine desulfurase